jgi:HNH endonuclease
VSVYIPAELQQKIRVRFSNRCAYCQTPENLSVVIFEFEHIIPRSTGGKTDFENLCLSCPTCNRYKADCIAALDPITQQDVALFHPQQNNWADHFAWSHDATVIIGLTPAGRATIGALRMNRTQMIRVRRMWHAMGEHPPHAE